MDQEPGGIGKLFRRLRRPSKPESPLDRKQAELIRERLMNTGPHFTHLLSTLSDEEAAKYVDAVPSVVEREERLKNEYSSKEKPLGWKMTDPQNHDPDNFRYIVHSIINTQNDYVASLRGEPPQDYANRLWTDIDGFLARKLTSCTVVDELHRGTYNPGGVSHGFILDVPQDSVVAISRTDMGKPNNIQDQDGELARIRLSKFFELRQNTPSAQEFLNSKTSEHYNEVLVNGISKNGEQMKISGVFLIDDPFLHIPLYELYRRMSHDTEREVAQYKKKGYSDNVINGLIPGYKSILLKITRYQQRLQEAKDLSELLSVPIIHIPQFIHPQWYREYILPESTQ